MTATLYIIGGGGHACVIAETAQLRGYKPILIVPSKNQATATEQILEERFLKSTPPGKWHIILGVGSIGKTEVRARIWEKYAAFSEALLTVIHPAAFVSPSASIATGTFVAQGAQVGCQAKLNHHVIINTGAIVDHNASIGAFSHVAPGATLSGDTHCGEHSHIGVGATIIQGIKLADKVVVGAGSVVINNIAAPGTTWVGVPARQLKRESVTP